MARLPLVGTGKVERPVDAGGVGGGARGACAAGALSVLLPRPGDQVRVVVGRGC
jgi:hypothetical protein